MGSGIFSVVLLLWFVALPIFIGFYVWRDSGRRGMNQLLWTLIAVLIPNLVGLIIYLVVARMQQPSYPCPRCGHRASESFIVCPNCGHKLQQTCHQCNKGVQPEWKLCPYCAQELTEE